MFHAEIRIQRPKLTVSNIPSLKEVVHAKFMHELCSLLMHIPTY
jgi:hypothetical protein